MRFNVRNRMIYAEGTEIVVGDNADYVAEFTFDAEWIDKTKTVRFEVVKSDRLASNTYVDKVLDVNNRCDIPLEVLKKGILRIGVFSTEMSTVPCELYVYASIKEQSGSPIAPSQDIYAELTKRIDEIAQGEISEEKLMRVIERYLAEHPIMSRKEIEDLVAEYITDHMEELKGEDGFSPSVAISPIDGGHRVSILDIDGMQTFDVMDGAKGEQGIRGEKGVDGFSPIVSVTDIAGGHNVTITDASGNHSFDVMDGKDGQGGGTSTLAWLPTVSDAGDISWTQSSTTVAPATKNIKGKDGKNGADGNDGFSPTVSVTDITGGHTVTITDADGNHSFNVMDGKDGQGGGGGASAASVELLASSKSYNIAKASTIGTGVATSIGEDLALLDSVTNFDEIHVSFSFQNTTANQNKTNYEALYKPSAGMQVATNRFTMIHMLAVTSAGFSGGLHIIGLGGFTADNVFRVFQVVNSYNEAQIFTIESIKGIKYGSIPDGNGVAY